MTLRALVDRIRSEFLDDVTAPYMWKDADIVSALGQAERELARRLFLLADSTTAEICEVPVTDTGGIYPRTFAIDSRILRITRLRFPGIVGPLTQKTSSWLDANDPGWDDKTGVPTYFTLNMGINSITLDRQPTSGGTMQLHVQRMPLTRLTVMDMSSSLELVGVDDELSHGALKFLYLRPDRETYDKDLAGLWSKQFEADMITIMQDRQMRETGDVGSTPEYY